MRSLADAELFTRRYRDLRGLEVAPIWAFMFLMSAADAVGLHRPGNLSPVLLAMVPAVGATMLLHRYLDRRFGVVRRPTSFGPLGAFIGFIVFQGLMMEVGVARDFTAPALGLLAGYLAWRDYRFRKHWLVPAVTCALLSLSLPIATTGPVPSDVATQNAIRLAIIAATFCFAHLYDHRVLVRIFGDGA